MRSVQDAGRQFGMWVLIDVVLVVAFAAMGYATHHGALSPAGVTGTAAPFLLAYAATAGVCCVWRRPMDIVRTALPLWLGTVVGGLILRILLGDSAALPFQIVTAAVLGLFLVVPRTVAALILNYRRRLSIRQDRPFPSNHQGAAK